MTRQAFAIEPPPDTLKTQIDKFREAARQLETDDDEARFDEKLKRLARQKPKDEDSASGK